ncbi:MAG TPA: helix-turn-helix transcriptional regulator, partial [Actinophytocola sp.]|uniref:helix-turn-helix domain-containing protein n=1 Tax=Actinophytocola sp. TaxID=1872138 RepID=UPI002DB5FD1E
MARNPTGCYRELGEELRRRRETARLTGAELARRLGWSGSKVCRVERGQVQLTEPDMLHYLGSCGVYLKDAHGLLALRRRANLDLGYWLTPHGQWLPDSLDELIYHEAAADACVTYEPNLVHGLLQTPEYAHARIAAEHWRSPEDVERCVRIRMQRQWILHAPRPAQLTFFMHEHALRLLVGGPAVMHEQLLQLAILAALEHVTVRVVPAQSAFGGPFALFEYAEYQPLVCLDNHATVLFLEDRRYIEPYRGLVSTLGEVAM